MARFKLTVSTNGTVILDGEKSGHDTLHLTDDAVLGYLAGYLRRDDTIVIERERGSVVLTVTEELK